MANLTQELEQAVQAIQDPVRRQQVERVWQSLDEINEIKTQVLPVGKVRTGLKDVRERLHQGEAALIADRGDIRNATQTTVMISLETLARVLFDVIEKSASLERGRPADILAGLPAVPPEAAAFEIDFDRMAREERGRPPTDLEL
jgi:hypothetical protein